MKVVVGILRPLEIQQNFTVIEDGNVIKEVSSEISNVTNTINALAEHYQVTDFKLSGPSTYIEGIIKQVNTKFANAKDIKFEII